MSYISPALRRMVQERTGGGCEYCHLSSEDHTLPFEIDHIVSEKHRGLTEADNLCLSCPERVHEREMLIRLGRYPCMLA